uniref:Beta-lactamase domain-containing protein n=1 Tax=Panagrellus redivivus TaxID=6233 RepID=A0A7E4ZWW2_PANRE
MNAKRRPSAFMIMFSKNSHITSTFCFLIFVATLHIFAFIAMPIMYGRKEPIHGFVDPKFESVKKQFERNFMDGFERDGANVAIFYKNKPIVNLWAGNADSELEKPWTRHTRSLLFSTTKALSGLCIALLVDQGLLNYNDPVAKYWTEFGQNGKENTTVRQVLNHEAGLPYIDETISLEEAKGDAHEALRKIAAAKPAWVPGSASGYHPITYGWLIDGIVRGADPKGRSLKQFFNEEIAKPHGLDIDIGTEPDQLYRNAKYTVPTNMEYIRDIVHDPRLLGMVMMLYLQHPDAVIWKATKSPCPYLNPLASEFPFNNPEYQQLNLGSATGVSNAHDVAQLFSKVINNEILNASLVEELSRPSLNSWHIEKTVLYPIMKGHGFFYDPHPTKVDTFTFGHPGYGCQALYIDRETNLVIVYLSNGLKTATSFLCFPYYRLVTESYRVINQINQL